MCSAQTLRFNLIPFSFTGKSFYNRQAVVGCGRCPAVSAAMSQTPQPHQQPNSSNVTDSRTNYPVPLSPPLPAISKPIELARAMSASSTSSVFSLTRERVIYEDDWLIAVNKPHGIYCESVLASVPRVLADSDEPSKPGGLKEGNDATVPELHLANRLDRDTSGVMLITKSHRVAAKLVKAFTEHRVTKAYIALCVGKEPKWGKITIKSGHGRSKFGAWRVYGISDIGRTLPGGSVVRDMQTSFEVLSVNGQRSPKSLPKHKEEEESTVIVEEKAELENIDSSMKDEILVRACPRSGRTHQIRLHCQYLGIPIRGDVKYEGVYEWKGQVHDFHALHAESLSLVHPMTGASVTFHAPLPSWASQGWSDEVIVGEDDKE